MINNKQFKSWKNARKAYDSVSSRGKPGSVWPHGDSMLEYGCPDPGNQDLPFQLQRTRVDAYHY
jgi:hypothetical protein